MTPGLGRSADERERIIEALWLSKIAVVSTRMNFGSGRGHNRTEHLTIPRLTRYNICGITG
jgi:hypothetical protein